TEVPETEAPEIAPEVVDPLPVDQLPEIESGPLAPMQAPVWMIGELELAESQVRFESLIQGLEGLEFDIMTKMKNVPLTMNAIALQEELQKVELANIVVRDPYEPALIIMELPTIFVEFSLAGLAEQRIDKINLITPTLNVGESLFRWVDYQRNFRQKNEGASVGIAGQADQQSPDWTISTIEATSGQIVIAPTGIPIASIPFPFNAKTSLQDNVFDLKLEIPQENSVYTFSDFSLDLSGLEGKVEFNVPIPEENNNLVQTFTLDRATWKKLSADDIYLSVTFDQEGIYGEFGGEAYGGYAEGGFNFYLKDLGKWDAWVSGTELDTGAVTQLLVKNNFLMEGKLNIEATSEGRNTAVGLTEGTIKTATPGWIDITKLNNVMENLPEEWNTLKKSLTKIAVEGLKRFDYDTGEGN
ncbi:MAG: hypothetical protein AAF226_18215, partial [Verrucomicrobiota bacterium]